MDAKTLAESLNGREYRDETTPHEEQEAKQNGLVIAYGYSDDNLELRGAIYDELSAWDGTTALVIGDRAIDPDQWREDKQVIEKYGLQAPVPIKVIAKWDPKDPPASWLITVEGVEFFPFDIFEDDELFCRGAVFKLP